MLIAKVARDLVDVFFFVDLVEGGEEVGAADLAGVDAARVAFVDGVEYARDDCDGVFVLEFGVVGEEFEALWVVVIIIVI